MITTLQRALHAAFGIVVLCNWLTLGGCGDKATPGGVGGSGGVPAAGTGGAAGSAGAADGGSGGAAGVAGGDAGAAGMELGSTSCCEAHGGAGCADATIQDCVCQQVPSCCQSAWDLVCVELVSSLSCGSCKGDCCTSTSVTGCNDSAIEACVCKGDTGCCDDHWDDFCVTLVDGLSCGTCQQP
jgi:hypothetical protein